ncbi:hypothetical protein SEA_GILL_77 [Gordonia phage Gill]|nr:hypothetical protein SEA_GILL_77 [Gordonia phage Gill]
MTKMVFRESIRVEPTPQAVLIGQARILHMAQGRTNKSRIDIWFEVDAEERTLEEAARYVFAVPTGSRIADDYVYLGTVVMDDDLVWHIYMEGELASVEQLRSR